MRVREGHRFGDAQEDAQPLRQGEIARGVSVEPLALHQLHRVEAAPVAEPSHVVDRHDPWVLEPRQHLRLAAQARLHLGILHVEHLEGHAPSQLGVADDVHGPHPAGAGDAIELVPGAGEVRLAHRLPQPR